MNIPRYIRDGNEYIAMSENEIINKSKVIKKDNLLILNDTSELFIYLDNYSQSQLNLDIPESASVIVYLITQNSRKADIQMKVNLNENSFLRLFTNFKSKQRTSLNIDRSYQVAKNASLVLLNNLTYSGQLDLIERVYLNGESSRVDIDLLNIGFKADNIHVKQFVYHKSKKTDSQINNWMISLDQSKLDYYVNGTIEKGNELSNCHQSNKGIILSEKGQIKVEPTLYIDEYNVKASHGAAIGQVDENQLFYLLSRGLNEAEAKSLIISGYINPFVEKIHHQALQKQIIRKLQILMM